MVAFSMPLRVINHKISLRKLSVSTLGTTYKCMNISTTWCLQYSNIRCFKLKSNWLLLVLLLARICPSSTRKIKLVGIWCYFKFAFQIWEFSSLYQTVPALVTRRWLPLIFLFHQLPKSAGLMVPKSAGLMILLTFFHCEASVVSSMPATWMAANACCLRYKLCIYCNNVVDSDKKLQLCIFISCSLTMCSFKLSAMNALCNYNLVIERWLIQTSLHFPVTDAKSAGYSFSCKHRQGTEHIVSSDASGKTWSAVLSFSLLTYLLILFRSATIGKRFFHLKNSAASPGSTLLLQCCPFIVQTPFGSRLMWTLNGANYSNGSNAKATSDRIFLVFIGFKFLVLQILCSYLCTIEDYYQ